MEKELKQLLAQALKGSSYAYRRLGLYFWYEERPRDRILAMLCLEKAMEIGDEKAFFLFHKIFSKEKKVIDDKSYQTFWENYCETTDPKKKQYLKKYLALGTKEQKERLQCRSSMEEIK